MLQPIDMITKYKEATWSHAAVVILKSNPLDRAGRR